MKDKKENVEGNEHDPLVNVAALIDPNVRDDRGSPGIFDGDAHGVCHHRVDAKDSLVSDGGTLGDRLPIVTVAHGNAKLFDTLPQPDVFLEYHKRNGPPFTQIDVDPTRGPAIICSPVRFF